jgi:hypothetical protein
MTDRPSILLLCDDRREHAANVLQHIAALRHRSRHDVHTFNPVGTDGTGGPELEDFDVVVIHYTLVITLDSYFPPALRDRVASFTGLKVQFIQDEYRWIDAITECMRQLGIAVLFTLVPEHEVEKVYGPRLPGVQTVTTLAGYVPDELVGRPVPPLAARPLDVGYRGRTPPYWLGSFGQEKAEIGRGFLARAAKYGLRCDIGWTETDRIYGDRWIRFLTSCRATLGTESGATIADYDGSVERGVLEYLATDPTASFEDVARDVLAPYEGNLDLKVISPRQFEAAALRTALVLFPGGYSGLLEPLRHYIPLAKDFSNMDEVAARLRDLDELEAMVDRTYEDLVASGRSSLSAFVAEFDDLVEAKAEERVRDRQPTSRPSARHRARRVRSLRNPLIALYRASCALAALRLVARRRALRRLGLAWARSADARAAVPARRLANDLFKLAIVLDARAGRLGVGTPFGIQARYDAREQRLVLGSRPPDGNAASRPREPATGSSLASSLADGSLQEILWNHAAFGDYVWAPTLTGRKFAVHVGYHAMNGVHSFRALVLLAPRFPDLVAAALAPLTASSPASSDAVLDPVH